MGNKSLSPQQNVAPQNTPQSTDQSTQKGAGPRSLQSPGGGNAMANAVVSEKTATQLTINGTIIAGGPLSENTIKAINEAAKKVPSQWRRYVAYEGVVKVGGSLAWRANNPGNLRDASSKIGTVNGAVGTFAVFASLAEGRAAQRNLYLNKYGAMTVRAAIAKLTPPSENDTTKYLEDLKKAGIDIDKDVASQIDPLMTAIESNEGLIAGTEVARVE